MALLLLALLLTATGGARAQTVTDVVLDPEAPSRIGFIPLDKGELLDVSRGEGGELLVSVRDSDLHLRGWSSLGQRDTLELVGGLTGGPELLLEGRGADGWRLYRLDRESGELLYPSTLLPEGFHVPPVASLSSPPPTLPRGWAQPDKARARSHPAAVLRDGSLLVHVEPIAEEDAARSSGQYPSFLVRIDPSSPPSADRPDFDRPWTLPDRAPSAAQQTGQAWAGLQPRPFFRLRALPFLEGVGTIVLTTAVIGTASGVSGPPAIILGLAGGAAIVSAPLTIGHLTRIPGCDGTTESDSFQAGCRLGGARAPERVVRRWVVLGEVSLYLVAAPILIIATSFE